MPGVSLEVPAQLMQHHELSETLQSKFCSQVIPVSIRPRADLVCCLRKGIIIGLERSLATEEAIPHLSE